MDIVIDITGVAEMARRMEGGPAILQDEVERALVKSGFVVEGRAKELAPIDTGRLRDSITPVVTYPLLEVGTNVEYAPYQENGVKNVDGTWRIKPKKYLEGGFRQNQERIRSFFETATANITRRLGG